MTRDELAESLCSHSGVSVQLSKGVAKEIVKALFDEFASVLQGGQEITIAGVGKFFVKETAERNGVNPLTGAKLMVPKHGAVRFKVATALKKAVY